MTRTMGKVARAVVRVSGGHAGTTSSSVQQQRRLVVTLLAILVVVVALLPCQQWSSSSSTCGGGRGVVTATVYYATLEPFGEYSAKVESAYVRVFTSRRHPAVIAYYGSIRYVTPNLIPNVDCTATNACGAHIHSGNSCDTVALQGGHLYDNTTLAVDPWLLERYRSNAEGIGRYDGVVDQGTNDVDGRAFVVHNETGGRIACGILTVATSDLEDDDNDQYDNSYDDDYYDVDTYMCPPYSTVVRGIRRIHSFQDSCRCRDKFYPRDSITSTTTCAAHSCNDYQCPTHSQPRNNDAVITCLNSIRDCVCNDGYRKRGGYCVPKSSSSSSAPDISTTTVTTNYIGV